MSKSCQRQKIVFQIGHFTGTCVIKVCMRVVKVCTTHFSNTYVNLSRNEKIKIKTKMCVQQNC